MNEVFVFIMRYTCKSTQDICRSIAEVNTAAQGRALPLELLLVSPSPTSPK